MNRVLKACAWATLLTMGYARAQAPGDWQKQLVERPLYMRGFWQESTLEFDATGKPMKEARPGPLTLSGVNVTSVSVRGSTMVIHANRVALVANASGRLERRTPESSTRILFSMLKNNVFKAKEEMKITLHADSQGDFAAPVKAVFADGLKDLAKGVPVYWGCYAQGYLARDLPDDDAARLTASCLKKIGMDDEVATSEDFHPPVAESAPHIHVPPEVFELGVSGRCETRVLIAKDGMPVGFQIVVPVGAGLDEELLQAESRVRYRPATVGGSAIRIAISVPIDFRTTQN